MTNLRESLQRVPVNLRFALLTELQELDGYQNADLSALANENELLAALASAVNGIAQRKRRRVVITGIGAITPVANTAKES